MDNVNNGLLISYLLLLIGCNVVQCDDRERNNRTQDLLFLHKKHIINEAARKSNENNPLTRLIPMLAMPFLVQTIFLPMLLLGIKFMLIQSIILGKFAIIFWIVNLITNHIKDQKGYFYSHNIH